MVLIFNKDKGCSRIYSSNHITINGNMKVQILMKYAFPTNTLLLRYGVNVNECDGP